MSISDTSVVICAYTEERWDDLQEAILSVQHQTLPALEVIIVIDHNPALLERVRAELPGVTPVENAMPKGVSGARNSGVARAKGTWVAFLDDDAVALPDWLEQFNVSFQDPRTLGVGGQTVLQWVGCTRPGWLPEEFNWVLGGTYRGMPEKTAIVRNVWTGNMTIRRQVFDSVGGFRLGFGKVGKESSPEDTDLCIRAQQQWPDGVWVYQPLAKVAHKVPQRRATWHYFSWRCFNEGLGKAHLARMVGSKIGLQDERHHTLYTLPQGVICNLSDGWVRKDAGGVLRAGAIIAGFALTSAGYLKGLLKRRAPERKGS
jgi:glycosyltransferase involved in cell wall biosynthesis